MLYLSLSLTIAAMLLYMFWHAGFSMRKERIAQQRVARRAAMPRRRVRLRH
jgi:hypothetical protein